MNLFDLFDVFLERKQIAMLRDDRASADTLRVTLLKKFKDYKQQMTALEFLGAEFEDCVVSMEWNEATYVATYFIRKRKRIMIDYQLLEPPTQEISNGS